MSYRNVGAHAEDLDDGRVVGVGEEVELNKDDLKSLHNKRLIDEGTLIEIPQEKGGGDK
jgi:hypothetical protein